MKIMNLTQHKATPDQIGVCDLPEDIRDQVSVFLTFSDPPEGYEMIRRAEQIARVAKTASLLPQFSEQGMDSDVPILLRPRHVMIGGAPFFMSTLESVLIEAGFIPLYAFSRRESVEERQTDGSARKVSIFRHVGFVVASPPDPTDPEEN